MADPTAAILFSGQITISLGAVEWPGPSGVAVPADVLGFSIELTTDLWPTSPVLVELFASYDNGATWNMSGSSSYTNNWAASLAKPTPPHFTISSGWGTDQPRPQFVKAKTTSPSPFTSIAVLTSR